MTDQATLAARLSEAEEALHTLLLGRKPVQVKSGEDTVTYTAGDTASLRAYIRELKLKLGQPVAGSVTVQFR